MNPIVLGLMGWAALALAKRAKTRPAAEQAQQTYYGATPEPVPLVTSFPVLGTELPPEVSIEQFLTQIESAPETVTTLTPQGQFRATGAGGAC